ncbi:MAG: 50S ribosomal protein L17 [Candidatus Coatesbacteria bacterium]|nr:MAG: 50S ribosomal protein L17 [Candidatus Coatesbacteria bacterium]
MRHKVSGRKLGRDTAHRTALLRNLATELLKHERICTTLAKAKETRRFSERIITLGKKDTLHAKRLAARHISDKAVHKKLFTEIAPRFADRPGGYTRIFKLGRRQGDGAYMALIELVERAPEAKTKKKAKK